ncbi:uncharacterized protein LOC118421151 [Branchiostoma floridae]|uniref:Uncharacterized protein LOC118421151 n=1 Tax=Branchiostoma floridae TaxID=7739 RepID=A0A9J7LM02_BRAFL|nr:uncharacterized protein LOC118421151 [Branchiostoma floridae]
MGTHPMDKKAETWRRKMAGGWLLVVLGLCLAIAPSCAGESGGYSLQLGLTLTQGYFPNNTYIVNITRDGGRVEEYKGYRHGAVFSRVSVKAIDGENMPVGTFVELLYSSMRTCTEMSRTGAQVLEGTDCPNLLFPLTLTWKAPMWDVGKINFM